MAYIGKWTAFGRSVFIEQAGFSRPLQTGRDGLLRPYAWGVNGREARELAHALITHATRNEPLARRLAPAFAADVISRLPSASFRLDRDEVLGWIRAGGGSDMAPAPARVPAAA
jgi:uncharacterized protein DUF6166